MAQKGIKATEQFLDERYAIAWMHDKLSQADMIYYRGALEAVMFLGYDWKRDKDGKHKLFKK
jgi:hypothetical protein